MGEEQLFPLSYHVFVLNVVCDFLENIGNGYCSLVLDNKFKAGAGADKIIISSSRKLKFGPGTISVFAMMGR